MKAKAWFLLFRPWSFTATLVPFLAAAGFVCGREGLAWGRWAAGLLSGLLFQAAVNLLNTWGDEKSGVDAVPGAVRTTPQVHEGLVSMGAVLAAGLLCAAGACAAGLPLCAAEGVWDWPLFACGALGALGALNYSTGVKFKYCGLGVPFVTALMGPIEVCAAVFLLVPPGLRTEAAWALAAAGCVVSVPVASLVGAIMHGNDMRDVPTDVLAGIRTQASAEGPGGALAHYAARHALPYVFAVAAAWWRDPWMFLPLLALPLGAATVRSAFRTWRGAGGGHPPWRGLERASGGVHCVYGLLYAAALALSRSV